MMLDTNKIELIIRLVRNAFEKDKTDQYRFSCQLSAVEQAELRKWFDISEEDNNVFILKKKDA